MECRYVGSHVELIRPATGESLGGKCVARTGEGWIIEAQDEEVFGPSPVVVWLRADGDESVIEGRLRPINGPFMSLRPTGTLLRVSNCREDRHPIDGVSATCTNLGESVQLELTNVGCRGFGFVAASLPPNEPLVDFTIMGPAAQFQVTGRIAHVSPVPSGQFRGGVELKLESNEAVRKWLAVLATCAKQAA